ncbi:methyltransferase domain protein [Mariprofundus micogutta]|uniref:Methyltransferase domain protein n=2 Tax=Mariprofundus micogutta TaxID=1921010 RepID=A0A1L8CLH0_9PROT|nr:methyltransferase domain protein [Mariprofundus micogutta]
MIEQVCNVCGDSLADPVFSTVGEKSITSLCELVPTASHVFFCRRCGHVLTSPMKNIEAYYSEDYQILIDSEEEDQLVSFPDGSKIFRFELQVDTIFDKMDIPLNAKVLDYGCAKSTTLRKMCERRTDLKPYLFDVSENYLPFWDKFADSENWAVFDPKPDWKGNLDVVTSFFSLEHVSEPVAMMKQVHALLKDQGFFYCIVPNTFTNTADFVVADHVNHFSVLSIHALLVRTGFEVLEIDQDVHYGAFVIMAKKVDSANLDYDFPSSESLASAVNELSEFWSGISRKIEEFEQQNDLEGAVAIYGSGFYGTYIASCLTDMEKVVAFVDQNPFRQGLKLFGKDIVSPEKLPVETRVMYVGLNPTIARESIRSVGCLADRNISYCYL